MKKIVFLFITLLFTLTLASCKKGKEINLSYDEKQIEVFVGDEVNVKPNVEVGKKVKSYELEYILSSDIATIKDGILLAKKAGTVELTVVANNKDKSSTTLTIVIKEKEVVKNEYIITFNLDGGVQDVTEIKFKEDENVTLPTPTKEGYKFLGWYEGETKVENIINKNYTLVAKWEKELTPGPGPITTYTIILDVNGGNALENTRIEGSSGIEIVLPVPTKDGYTFAGWYNGEVKFEETTMPASNITLIAKWEENVKYTISLDGNGVELEQNTITFADAKEVKLPTPVKEGYNFLGWYEGDVLVKTVENRNYSLKAMWEIKTYTITFNLNGGELEETKITFKHGESVELPIPTKEGYTFRGWFHGSKPVEVVENKNYVLSAGWNVIKYTVTYELDGGKISSSAPVSVSHGTEITLLTPSKDLNKFLGWSLEQDSTEYVSKIKVTEDVVLYAHWEQVAYKINYIYEDGQLPKKQATCIADIDAEFWPQFAAWYGTTDDVQTFRSAVIAKWLSGSEGGYKLYVTTGVDTIDVNYFVNDPETDPMWKDWLTNIEAGVQNINKDQSIYKSTYAGYMRIAQFFTEHSNWTPARAEAVYSKFQASIPLVASYEIGVETELVELVIDDGRTFLGWYDNEGNKVEKISSDTTGEVTLTAKWSESTPVESFELVKVDRIERFETYQMSWTFLPDNATNKRVEFISSNPEILSIDKNGIMTAHQIGTVSVEVIVKDNSNFNVKFDVEVYVDPYIDAVYETTSIVIVNETIQIDAMLQQKDDTLSWKSLNENIATVDESGKITGLEEGYAEIVAYASTDESIKQVFGITVVTKETFNELSTIFTAHNDEVHYVKEINVAYDYDTRVIGSISDLLFNYDYKINSDYYIKPEETNNRGYMSSIEFITVHYSGMPLAHQDGEVIAQSLYNAYNKSDWGGTSWHYSTGNDGIFHSMNEGVIGWHAGDGTGVAFKWNPTGVKYSETDPQWPTWGISPNAKFTINGKETSIKVPEKTQRGSEGYVTDSKWLNSQGFAFKVVNGEYYMGNTWWCYSNVWEGRICSKGGNLNSIGIESACNYGSDLWYTYQITSKLVARLMIKYNLDITRVVGHHFFAAKDCPQPLLENNLELWWKFIELVKAEHELLTKLQDYTITCKSNNPELVSDNGRVLDVPNASTTVSYTLTITNNKTGASKEITLSSIIHGEYML